MKLNLKFIKLNILPICNLLSSSELQLLKEFSKLSLDMSNKLLSGCFDTYFDKWSTTKWTYNYIIVQLL